MKNLLLLLLALPVLTISGVHGQHRLSESRQSGEFIYVYRLSPVQMHDIFIKGDNISEDYLQNYITRYPADGEIPELQRGNYALVQAVENRLVFDTHTVDDMLYEFRTRQKYDLFLSDRAGDPITDATVKTRNRKFRYDSGTKTYTARKPKKNKLIEIDNRGVMHYIDPNTNPYPRYGNMGRRGIFGRGGNQETYTGYMLFSKPIYRPGDTVRMKVYVADGKGHGLDRQTELRLYKPFEGKNITLATLEPYRPGAYIYEFPLADSLGLRLDYSYSISLTDPKNDNAYFSGNMRYEDYELDRITFSVRTPKDSYNRRDSVRVFLKAADDNGMAAFDGQATMTVRAGGNAAYHTDEAFIPDILWQHTVRLDQPGEVEVLLPDSIFPRDISMNYSVDFEYLGADNEKQNGYINFYRDAGPWALEFKMTGGRLDIRETKDGDPVGSEAVVTAYSPKGTELSKQNLTLPAEITPPGNVSYYTVKTPNSLKTYYVRSYELQPVSFSFERKEGDAKFDISNPQGYAFWYTVWRGESVLDQGYSMEKNLSAGYSGGNKFRAMVEYMYGGYIQRTTLDIDEADKTIAVDINTPQAVYPGQTAGFEVALEDGQGRPLKNADVTAYAYTSKFKYDYIPSVPRSTTFGMDGKMTMPYPSDKELSKVEARMSWDRWKTEMELENIEYYKFIHPGKIYTYSEPARDSVTQLAPFVAIDGDVQGVHILWIDNVPHFFSGARQMQVYSFPVAPGRHSVRIRTWDRTVYIPNLVAKEGHKNIISVDGSTPGYNADYYQVNEAGKKEKGKLSYNDIAYLQNYMITIDNNFGSRNLNGQRQNIPNPAYIGLGSITYYLNPPGESTDTRSYYPAYRPGNILAGPFPYREMARLCSGRLLINSFEPEGGYNYTIRPGHIKQKSWSEPNVLKTNRIISSHKQNTDLGKQALIPADIDSIQRAQRHTLLKNSLENKRIRFVSADTLRIVDRGQGNERLQVVLDTLADGKTPIDPIYIHFYNPADSVYHIFRGGERNFYNLPSGRLDMVLLMDDLTYYEHNIYIKPGGQNYLRLKGITTRSDERSRTWAERLTQDILFPSNRDTFINAYSYGDYRSWYDVSTVGTFRAENAEKGVVTGKVVDEYGDPLIGATVIVSGTQNSTVTNIEGLFELKAISAGELEFRYLGYQTAATSLIRGYDYHIVMNEDSQMLMDEVVVVGYGTQKKLSLVRALSGRANGLRTKSIFGTAAASEPITMSMDMIVPAAEMDMAFAEFSEGPVAGTGEGGAVSGGIAPMIILNGLPYGERLEDIDEGTIATYKTLSGDEAVKLYGEQARGGVVIITTRTVDESAIDGGGMQLRHNFRDDAFWQPALTTDAQGKASFQVTYPDDITSWKARVFAMEGRRYIAQKDITIRSFKALNAQLSLPRFAIESDRFNGIGRLTNYMGDTIRLSRTITVDGKSTEGNVTLAASHVDSIAVVAGTASAGDVPDSLTVAYTIHKADGFFDGEQRSIPVYPEGILETNGQFEVIGDGNVHSYGFEPADGDVTMYAEASSLDLFMREIDKVDKYSYLCNEQMASKIKALITKKRISKMFGIEFKDDKKIEKLIRDLNRNKNGDNLWGWWNRDRTELWISKQIVEAMIEAEKEGFAVDFNRRMVSDFLIAGLNRSIVRGCDNSAAKRDYLNTLLLLSEMGTTLEYDKFLMRTDTIPAKTVYDTLLNLRARQVAGAEIQIDSVLSISETTMTGGRYWGEKRRIAPLYRYNPYVNDIQSTLLAYRILRDEKGQEKELANVRNYFFETRKGGSWHNTFEASNIMEIIMPDMLRPGERYSEVTAEINGVTIDSFPYTGKFKPSEAVTVRKEGTLPMFFTAYQQKWNKQPERENKGFEIRTVFRENRDTVSVLKAGKTVQLNITVKVDADAEYVMIEVPIPAGCSYENKWQTFYRNEIHREHYRDRVSIFCARLPKGEHKFTVSLLPRFTGEYRLNPARAELMYFPTFYGREQMKRINID